MQNSMWGTEFDEKTELELGFWHTANVAENNTRYANRQN